MKKLVKKLEFKPIIVTLSLIFVQTFFFFLSKLFQGQPHTIGNFIDEMIPFNSIFIIPYFIWYLLLVIVPYYLYLKDKDMFYKYIICYFFTCFVSTIIFFIYPTIVIRPDINVTGITSFLTKFIYDIDTPAINCFPSLHCAISMIFLLTVCFSKKVNIKFKIIIFILSILIMMSTLFVKQHVFIDLISGDVIALIIFLIFKNNKIMLNKTKNYLNK